ncbi:MAG: hypothetical protein DPW12_14695 [Rhodocyclaceae bacterium]|nr:hypothetical protein [Bacteroidia bacterium]MCQ3925396.1 hypothetical protein [Rhodocyclaceae bacterium]HNQ57797.1 hypothetical protein [Candidatus Desulfobacillus denitrificans]
MRIQKMTMVSLMLLATTPVLAQQDDCDVGARMRQAATEAADRERQALELIAQRQKQMATQAATSCIDKYMGLNLSSMLGFTSLDFGGIVAGIVSGAVNAACRVVDNQVNQITQPFNQSMVLPGGVGRVDTRLFGTTGNVSVTTGIPGVVPQIPLASASTAPAGSQQPGLIDRASAAVSNLFK